MELARAATAEAATAVAKGGATTEAVEKAAEEATAMAEEATAMVAVVMAEEATAMAEEATAMAEEAMAEEATAMAEEATDPVVMVAVVMVAVAREEEPTAEAAPAMATALLIAYLDLKKNRGAHRVRNSLAAGRRRRTTMPCNAGTLLPATATFYASTLKCQGRCEMCGDQFC